MRQYILPGCAAAAVLTLLALGGAGWSDVHPVVVLPNFRVPTGVVVLASALAAGVGTFSFCTYAADATAIWRIGYAALLPVLAIAVALLLAASVPALSLPRAAAGMLLGTLAMIAGVRCIELIADGEPIGFETHWGGLGGGSGGWKLLPAASLAVMTISLLGGALAILIAEPQKPLQKPAATQEQTTSPPDAKRFELQRTPASIHASTDMPIVRSGPGQRQ